MATRGKVNGGLSRYRVAKTKALAEGPSPSPWREQAGKEREERRELAQRLALAAPIAAPAPEDAHRARAAPALVASSSGLGGDRCVALFCPAIARSRGPAKPSSGVPQAEGSGDD